MTTTFKRAAILTLLALALVGCDMGATTPTPVPTASPTTQVAASPTAQASDEQPSPEASVSPEPANRPATAVLPDTDPINPIDPVREDATKQPLPITPVTTAITGEATSTPSTSDQGAGCTPTRPDAEGPFYEPDAPERTSIGKGHVLKGVVRSSDGCRPIPGAQLEFWQVNDQAVYDDDHRATMHADGNGAYSFESNYPQAYGGRPSHIHLRVTADGYQTLITQFYPQQGETEATFDIVLVEQ
ncbi:MAG TPA: hypothetical protein VGE04_02525 [Chloroflexia bacterium]